MAAEQPLVAVAAAERERFMDALRVLAVLVVIAGHWFVLIPYVQGGLVGGRLLYQVRPEFWPLTWAFEVLPLFFFVGGFANYVSYHRRAGGAPGAGFKARRSRRLLRPTLVFLAVWVVFEVALQMAGVGAPGLLRGMRIGQITPFESLWFVPVYLAVVLASPATIRLHHRLGALVPVLLLAAAALVDLAAWKSGFTALLLANLAPVWLLPHQLGYFYAEGRLTSLRSRVLVVALLGGLVVTAVLTSLPFYGRNLLDSGYAYWGVTAPTLPFALLGVWAVAAALLARRALLGWLRRERVWKVVRRLNSAVMTLFLWHMTAYFAVLLLLAGRGVPLPSGPDVTWWAERPLFLLAPIAALVPLVWAFQRFEAPAVARPEIAPAIP